MKLQAKKIITCIRSIECESMKPFCAGWRCNSDSRDAPSHHDIFSPFFPIISRSSWNGFSWWVGGKMTFQLSVENIKNSSILPSHPFPTYHPLPRLRLFYLLGIEPSYMNGKTKFFINFYISKVFFFFPNIFVGFHWGRKETNLACKSMSLIPSNLTANKPAFVALFIATVATGTPLGIYT